MRHLAVLGSVLFLSFLGSLLISGSPNGFAPPRFSAG